MQLLAAYRPVAYYRALRLMQQAQNVNQFSCKAGGRLWFKKCLPGERMPCLMWHVLIQEQTNKDITSVSAACKLKGSGTFTDYLNIPTTLVPGEFFGGTPGSFAPIKFGTKYNASGGFTLTQVLV